MQQEDDLRALAKIMEFGRAVSIFILVVHVYVYCYPSMSAWHLNLDVIDRILMNFDRTTGIFGCILWTKLMAPLDKTDGTSSAGHILYGYYRSQG